MNNADLDVETILCVPLIFKEFKLVYNYKVPVYLNRITREVLARVALSRGTCYDENVLYYHS